MLIQVLLAVQSSPDRIRLRKLLDLRDVSVAEVETRAAVRRSLAGGDFDLLVTDRELLSDKPEIMIRSVRALPEQPEVIVLSDREDAVDRTGLLALGCLAVLNLRLEDEMLRDALRTLVSRRREEAITHLRADRPEERYSLGDFVSDSPAMQVFLELARRVVPSDTSVLLLGETGVGKERLARAIHTEGPRSAGPFMAVNCGALPESLLESELFGHEEGAFTGATRSRKGYFQLAHGGTLFLDEVGEMPTHLQVNLLRALDERRVYRVGGEKPIDVDVRVMASTNRDIESEMKHGRFRPDLFYRLAVVTLTIPPLRERREDIAPLVQSYMDHFRVQTGRQVTSIGGEAVNVLARYDWPGNVRELVNAMERAVLLCASDEIGLEDLPTRVVKSVRGVDAVSARLEFYGGPSVPLPDELVSKPLSDARRRVVAAFETSYLSSLLQRTGGRIGETAARAGVNERSLYDLMKRRGLRKEDFRASRIPPAGRAEQSRGSSS